MMPPRRKPPEDQVDAWLMSYADMITLLLCFFIIFVSVSEPKKDRLNEISQGIANRFGSVAMSTPFQDVLRSLLAMVETRQLLRDVAVTSSENSVDLELASARFFKPDSAELVEAQLPVLAEIATAFKNTGGRDARLVIESHTNDVPVHSALYPSNWELSAARSARLARFFIEQGIPPGHIKAVGYADSQPKVPNEDANGDVIMENRGKNERVVLKLERVF